MNFLSSEFLKKWFECLLCGRHCAGSGYVQYDVTKNLLHELTVLIVFSSGQMIRINLCFMLFILMGERSSSSNQSIIMNVFTNTQEMLLGWNLGGQQSALLLPCSADWFSGQYPPPCSEYRDSDLLKIFTINYVTLGKCLVLASVPSFAY